MSSGWKRLYPKPAGSLPGGIVTQWGVALITVLILVFVAIWLATGGSEPAGIDSIGGEVSGPARSFAGQMAAQVQAESLRAETRRAAADRTLQAQQRQEARESATGAIGGGQVTMDEALLLAGPSPETGEAYTEQEFELRERLRLEALERRSRSLRSSPVAQTYRQSDRARSPTEAEAEPGPVEAIRAEGAAALSQALGTFQGVTGSLEDEIAAEAVSDQASLRPSPERSRAADRTRPRPFLLDRQRPRLIRQAFPVRRRNRPATMPTLRGLRAAMIRQGGNGSMRERSLRPCLSPNYRVTFPARSWPRLPCRFTPQTASGF